MPSKTVNFVVIEIMKKCGMEGEQQTKRFITKINEHLL